MVKMEALEVQGKAVQGILVQAPGGEGHPNIIKRNKRNNLRTKTRKLL